MDIIKKQLARIQQQLAGLSASQKMLTLTLVAIMVMTFVWWGKYAGTSEMEPIFQTPLSSEEMQQVRHVLQTENIAFEPSGTQILVPSEKKDFAIAALAEAQAMPHDSSGNIEDIIGKVSPFASPDTNEKLYNGMGEQWLANVISKMHGVAEAYVHVDPTHDRLIGGAVEPSATVSVRMREPGTANKNLADSIAAAVAGTNAHMKRSRVSVIIDDRVYPIRDRDPELPDGEIDEQQAKAEKRLEDRVKEALRYFNSDVIAVVHAKIDTISLQKSETVHPKIVGKDRTTDSETSSTSTPQGPAAESGAVPNSALAIPAAAATSSQNSTTETEHTRSEQEIIVDETVSHSNKPAGEANATSATVSVPRSYFINVLKSKSTSSKDPDVAEVEKEFAVEKSAILAQVMHVIDIKDESQVSVDMYFDAPLLMASGSSSSSSGSGSSTSGMTITLTSHIKEIAVGALALLSLFMISSMVKKSAPAPVIAAAIEAPQKPQMMSTGMDIAGEVGEGAQALDGMELDEDAVKSQQMVEQVSTMVKENPDAAAGMVKRWLNR